LKSIIGIITATIFTLAATFILYIHADHASDNHLTLQVGKRYEVRLPNNIRFSDSITYEQELEQFSNQLTRAFDIPLSEARKYAPVIIKADINTDLSDINIASLIMTESSFRPTISSSVGAYGSTQIRPLFWNDFCQSKSYDIFDFEGNIMCGAEIVAHLKNRYCEGALSCALEHYNVGRRNLLSSVAFRKAGKRYTYKVINYSEQLSSTIEELHMSESLQQKL
jgi:soluble lytic murein transglycosylase-like protein